jgi:dTDP-4-amino-4,6-dideoxygalactose transaminase
MTDVAAAMGIAQLRKVEKMWQRRLDIAHKYNQAFSAMPELQIPLIPQDETSHGWHLYILRLNLERLCISRTEFIERLRVKNIGTSVHFIPLHIHPYYQKTYGYKAQDFPVAFNEYQRIISLPIYSRMSEQDIQDVIEAVKDVVKSTAI